MFGYTITIIGIFSGVLTAAAYGEPKSTNTVWFEPPVLNLKPHQLKQHHVITCHHNLDDCQNKLCLYKWRVNNNIFKESNDRFVMIESTKSLLLRAPFSKDKQIGTIACVVEQKGRPLGEVSTKVTFVDPNGCQRSSDEISTTKVASATAKKSLGQEISVQLKEGKNVALFIIIGALFFIISLIWAIVLHCHLSSIRQAGGYQSIGGEENGRYRKFKNNVSQKVLQKIQLKKPPAGAVPLMSKDDDSDSDDSSSEEESSSESDTNDNDGSSSSESSDEEIKKKSNKKEAMNKKVEKKGGSDDKSEKNANKKGDEEKNSPPSNGISASIKRRPTQIAVEKSRAATYGGIEKSKQGSTGQSKGRSNSVRPPSSSEGAYRKLSSVPPSGQSRQGNGTSRQQGSRSRKQQE